MTNEQLKKIFSIPEKDLLEFIINKLNLSKKQKEVIQLYYIDGNTEYECSEILNISVNGFQNMKKDTKKHLEKAWANDRLIKMILNE